jgi:hypothetical protein
MGRPAERNELPPAAEPSADAIRFLTETALLHRIQIVGLPLQ